LLFDGMLTVTFIFMLESGGIVPDIGFAVTVGVVVFAMLLSVGSITCTGMGVEPEFNTVIVMDSLPPRLTLKDGCPATSPSWAEENEADKTKVRNENNKIG